MKRGWWLIDQLIQQGVTHFCIAPGSRSSPLVLAAASHPQAKTVVHFDERGMAFYALGIGKATRRPAAVIATSGTAPAHFLPAALEAFHSKTPLILLTADRPHELRDSGANQTTDQTKLFSHAVKWQVDLAPDLDEKTIRSIGANAFFQTLANTPGPIQINCPFREPFSISADPLPTTGKPVSLYFPGLTTQKHQALTSKGIILLGQIPCDPAPVMNLAKRIQWPLFADILSNARCHMSSEQIIHFDYAIRSQKTPKPEFVLHIGERLTSKTILEWTLGIPTLHVSPYPFLQDPNRNLSGRVQSNIDSFCEKFDAPSDAKWLSLWQKKDQEIAALFTQHFQSSFTEAHALRSLPLPEESTLFLGNGMPIRDADRFYFPKNCRGFLGNRGLSGIDGNIATAAGIADGLGTPVVAWIGDQAALHDLSSFPLILNRKLLVIISNNFGGGIFSHLPISASPHFETYFAASHNWQFEQAAAMFGIPYLRTHSPLTSLPASGIVEIVSDRAANHIFQKDLAHLCSHV